MNRTQIKHILTSFRVNLKKEAWKLFLAMAVLFFMLSTSLTLTTENAEKAAADFKVKVEKRLGILEKFADQALNSDHGKWLSLEKLPPDMVIYRYVYDTLQSWCNQFPISNDDISTRMVFERLSNLRSGIISPLSDISEETSYMNLGSKWYIMRSRSDDLSCRIVYGLEIQNTLLADRQNSDSGVNPRLKLPKKFVVTPLNHTGGVTVDIDGKPLFKVISETTRDIPFPVNMILQWIALACFIISVLAYYWQHASVKAFPIVVLLLAAASAMSYRWGSGLKYVLEIFSPGIYADGAFFFSFGALMIVNCFVFCYLLCIYLGRKAFMTAVSGTKKTGIRILFYGFIIITFAGAGVYVHLTLVSLIMNSSLTLELYQWFNLSVYSAVVYVSYIAIMFCMMLILQLLRPAVHDLTGLKYNVLSKKWFFGFSVICALYLTVTVGVLGFRKEQDRLILLTNRLAVNRDLSLEIQLQSIEDEIASDPAVASLSQLDRSDMTILNRLNENYLYRISQDYSVTATLCRDNPGRRFRPDGERTPCLDYFGRKFISGTPIADNSRFRFIEDDFGNSGYIGSFIYYSTETGVVHMFLEIEEKDNLGENSYMNILGRDSRPGNVSLPPFYSYARFISGKLVGNRGNYPYPSILGTRIADAIEHGTGHFRENGYIHFINRISDDEVIITSRTTRSWLTYFINFSYLIIFTYGILYLIPVRRGRKQAAFRNYYRSQINFVLSLSLFVTLIVMTSASIAFVTKRNNTNMYNMMSNKITTLQSLMETKTRLAGDWHDLNSPDIAAAMEDIRNTTKSDITLYTPGGKVFRSTTPEIFEKMILGTRMNQEAYYNIRYRNQRFFINREEIAGHPFYSLYAPLFNDKGAMVAILNSPYIGQNYVFRHDAFFYSAIIINVFIVLLLATVLLSTTIVNAIFKPLVKIGEKMSSTDLHSLEKIKYDRNDEISALVNAYNRMVTDLAESTRKLAQAERDKAWSEMARQVAHEIKNPLTPIKLEIQRLIRLKHKNDPNWDEKFDKVSAVVLEHIDILTETANEFSTFAKLYSEEPVLLDLDATLRDQLVIFDNKDDIDISYIGMPNAFVKAPKPQLIRVFVNLLTNAIQAIEIQKKDTGWAEHGKILICLRNSTEEGYYDIVFDDSGPGVSEENQARLFTPNFTTKNGGTGLGLAICRNIVEKCNGEIFYRKSYSLGGASFTVRLPKEKDQYT